jgi:glycine/sarcosine N-methyltransferase
MNAIVSYFCPMAFYESISPYYDDIFPLNPAQVNFILESLDSGNIKLLDVGCGTGSLSIALSHHFLEVYGIDPDDEMLKLAEGKAGSKHPNLSLHPYGMLDLERMYEAGWFDAVLCFGNTLVHLASEEEVLKFLKQARTVLKPGGKLLMQIINYDRIFRESIRGLPTIENEQIRFVRNYHYPANEAIIDFETILTVKSSGQEIRNSIKLFPISRKVLEEMLVRAGFTDIEFFGNFKRDALQEESIPLVLEARSAGPML